MFADVVVCRCLLMLFVAACWLCVGCRWRRVLLFADCKCAMRLVAGDVRCCCRFAVVGAAVVWCGYCLVVVAD